MDGGEMLLALGCIDDTLIAEAAQKKALKGRTHPARWIALAASMIVVLAAAGVEPLMPWLLSFAAGAMLYVVVEELVPQAHSRAGTCGFVLGFLVMMVLDVALG